MIWKMNPKDLKPHPLNEEIYGKEPVDPELVKSIKKIGLLEMLVIKEDGTVISGHRRLKAVLEAGHEYVKKVPCNIVGFADEFEEKEALVSYNIQRKKNDFQLSAEIEILDEIYKHRAKERQLAGLKQNKGTDDQGHTVVADSATTERDKKNSPGRTRDKIAEDLGISSRQVGMLKKLRKASESDDQVIAQIADRLLKDPMTKNRKYNLFLNFMKIYHECNNKNPKISEYATNMVSDIYGRFTKIEDAHQELSKYIKALENKEKALKNEYPSDDYESESKEYIEDESAISEKQNKPSDILRAKPVESNKPKVSQKDPFTFAIKHRNPEVAELAAKLRLKVDNKEMSSDEAKNIIKEKIRELKRVEQAQREMMKVPEEPGDILEKESERPTHNSSKMERPKDQNNVDTPGENIPSTLEEKPESETKKPKKSSIHEQIKEAGIYCTNCVKNHKYNDGFEPSLQGKLGILIKVSMESAKNKHKWDMDDHLLLKEVLLELKSS